MLYTLSFLLPLLAYSTAQRRPNYTHHAVLDPNGKFHVHWLPATNDSAYFTFECEVATQGWFGFGFSANGAMAGADMVIAWIDRNGRPQISDRHGPTQGNGFPPADTVQNYEIIDGRKNQTHTVVTIRRMQDTCDPNDWKITSDTTRLIWAYSDQLPTSANDVAKHTARGVHSAQLLTPQSRGGIDEILADKSVKSFDLRISDITLPTDKRTLYWCEIFELPKWTKHHVIANKMMVQKGNERYVHHLIVYSCGEKDMSQFLGKPRACFGDTQGFNPMKECGDHLAAWAVGGEEFVYPNNMGAPFNDGKQRQFVLLEMHYDNADLTPGITDSSTFRMYLTEQLRPVETGRFTMAVQVSASVLAIPPKQQRFTAFAYCPSTCTRRWTHPIYIFTGVLHTHLLGVAVKLRVIRNGTEIKSEMKDEHYDFNYQTPKLLSKPLELLPGDDLILECTYDSTGRDATTYGGYGSDQEMCGALMEYYPKRNTTTENCISFVDTIKMLELLGAKKDEIDLGSSDSIDETSVTVINQNGRNVSLIDWYTKDLKFTGTMANKLQDFMQNSPQLTYCGLQGTIDANGKQTNKTDGIMIPLNGPIPIVRPYVEVNTSCRSPTRPIGQ